VDCPFCSEIKRKAPTIFYEGREAVARIDATPRRFGHFEVISRTCGSRTDDLSEEAYAELWAAMRLARKEMARLITNGRLVEIYRELLLVETRPGFRACLSDAIKSAPSLQNEPILSWGIVMADGPEAGQTVPHRHLHNLPCWEREQNPRGWPRLGLAAPDPYLNG
jgi:diadenosine tetraphosphate (Ap4A) HIT family hydrolase